MGSFFYSGRNSRKQLITLSRYISNSTCLTVSVLPVVSESLWHRSGPNQTENPRRVFYAQYSCGVIPASSLDPRPLSLAVPCRFPSTMHTDRVQQSLGPRHESLEAATMTEAGEDTNATRLATLKRPPQNREDSASRALKRR